MRRKPGIVAVLAGLAVVVIAGAPVEAAAPNTVVSSVVGCAGVHAAGSGFAADGTAGQAATVGVATGGGLVLHAGFWGPRLTTATAVEPPASLLAPTALHANTPNPFNPQTRLAYTLAGPCRVRLVVFDARGQLVRTLVDAERPAGLHAETWNGTDDGGRRVASGLYFYRLHAGDYESVRKMTIVK